MAPKQVKKTGGMILNDPDKTVERVAAHKNVDGVIVTTRDGIPINTTMDSTATTLFVDGLMTLEKKCSSLVRQLDPTDEALFVRITTSKYELSVAPRADHTGFIIQRRNTTS